MSEKKKLFASLFGGSKYPVLYESAAGRKLLRLKQGRFASFSGDGMGICNPFVKR